MEGVPSCPMCGLEMEMGVAERFCAYCRMGMGDDKAYYLLYGPGRLQTFCSRHCVRMAVLSGGPRRIGQKEPWVAMGAGGFQAPSRHEP